MTHPEQSQPAWLTAWHALADEEYGADQLNELRSLIEFGVSEPEDTLNVAVAAAESGQALASALERPWSLYTPAQAAQVASAALAQLHSGAQALVQLGEVLQTVIGRGEASAPADGDCCPLRLAKDLAAEIEVSTARSGPLLVRRLQEWPSRLSLPEGCHETLAAVCGLLPAARMETAHAEDAYEDDEDFGCGCSVVFDHEGEEWNLSRGDSGWSVHRVREERPLGDGSIVVTPTFVTVTDATPHPGALVASVLAELEESG
ncbi:hypothetical protein [Streptomyces sp. TR02-1]|uniref:hypothetical protein n=1 Tax=Streptomyces sp. TR02-1 TaxID=3385977 RepID=UPI0039A0B620